MNLYETYSIMKVKTFNAIQRIKYAEAVNNYEYGRGGFPNLSMYIYTNIYGQEKTRGYVRKTETGSKLYKTKREARKGE